MNQPHYKMSIKLYQSEKSFGPGMMSLLGGVEETGSLQKSAKRMGMAYSKAWTMIRRAEQEWGFPMTERTVGGKDGGGSVVTVQAKRLMDSYAAFLKDAGDAVDTVFARHFSSDKLESIIRGERQPNE
ncbi:MAG: LysR family transcriptional regulator [Lachnospiraceae bacterium]|nr:LysR family transcriptional regulator [Lachnospiraceae bacterium]MDY5742785.1 LysR family transcriptional regulator [Lachnospiraceae bacterium]